MNGTAEYRDFDALTILSVTTGKLLVEFGKVHEFLEYMAGEPVWTHQLPRVRMEVVPTLLEQFPQFNSVDAEKVDSSNVIKFCENTKKLYPDAYTVRPMAKENHQSIDPLSELSTMIDPHKVVVVQRK